MDFGQVEEKSMLRRIVSWMKDIALVISLALFLVYAFGTQVKMAGQSMTPFLNSEDIVLMNRVSYQIFEPKRFDVVAFDKGDGKLNIKRVIGLPGETVQICEGQIYIDGEVLKADKNMVDVPLSGLAKTPIELGEEQYFLLGDNRTCSEDSRFADVGNVDRKQLKGKIWLKIFPFFDIKWI